MVSSNIYFSSSNQAKPRLRTYLGYIRLSKALSAYRNTNPNAPVNFTLKFAPYQLYPEASKDGEDKYEWYQREKYNDSQEKMKMYTAYMGGLGKVEGVDFDFHGTIANTLNAHRILQWIQEHKGEDAARKTVDCGYFFQKSA